MLTVNFFYPPFVYVTNGILKLVFGVAPWVDALSKALYVFVLSVSVFAITKNLLKDNLVATTAVAFINLYPETTVLSHTSMLDFPVMAMVALGLWLLLYWREQPSWKRTIALAAVLAATCMTKQIGCAFLVLPCLAVFVDSLRRGNVDQSKKLIVAGLMPPLVAAPWILANAAHVKEYIEFTKHTYASSGVALPSYPSVFTYFLQGLPHMLTPFLLALFVVAFFLTKPSVHRSLYLVTLSSFGGMLLISCITWTAPLDRYLMPAFLMPAIYSANFFAGLIARKQTYIKLTAALIMAVAAWQFLLINFTPYPLSAPAASSQSFTGMKKALGLSIRGYREEISNTYPEPPGSDDGQKWVLASIAKVDGANPSWLNVLINSRQFNAQTFDYLAKLEKSAVLPTTSRSWTIVGDQSDFSPTKAMYYQWYLLQDPELKSTFYNRNSEESFEQLRAFVKSSGHFHLVGVKSVADGTNLCLYRQN